MDTRPPDRPEEYDPPSAEDLYNKIPYEKLGQPQEPSRWGRALDALRSRLPQWVPERTSPFWDKAGEAAEQAGKRLAAKETRFGRNPYVATGIGLYEVGRYGKQIYGFIKEERILAKAEEVRFSPLHKSLESDRLSQLADAEDNHRRAFKEAVKGKDFHPFSSYQVEKAKGEVDRLSQPITSREYQLSRIGDSPQGRALHNQRLGITAQEAQTFERNYLVGTAGEKYQYLAHTAIDNLGTKHFDRALYPGRGMRFDSFAAERLYMDGYQHADIAVALRDKSPFLAGVEERLKATYVQTATKNFQPKFETPELNNARQALAEWRQQEGLAEGYTHTPNEWRQVEPHLQRATARQAAQFTEERLEQARAVLREYQANPSRKLTTTEEYQVELGRIHEHSSYPQNHDTHTSVKLLIAGHHPNDVAASLDKASPFAKQAGYVKFQEGEYGERVVEDAIEHIRHDQWAQRYMDDISKARDEVSRWREETRLDRLGLDYKENSSDRAASRPQSQQQNRDIEPSR